jgi:integrase
VQNVLIPLRLIFQDACIEYGWTELGNPFMGLKFPRGGKFRVMPFNQKEWKLVMEHMLPWYRPYFEFAVQTGLRPSEQVALKWSAIDDEFIHIELSRVRNLEKDDLKTGLSRRSIAIRPAMAATLKAQREMTKGFDSPYVFINTEGRPILQDKLRETWARVLVKAGLAHRRMYETRHTFASWALAGGETPEWVAKTLGHVDPSMVYRTYCRYIPNLTRQDGTAFERFYQDSLHAKTADCGTNCGTIGH